MTSYRVYKLNSEGRIVDGKWVEAPDEAQAKLRARAMWRDSAMTVELWEGARRVAVLPCDGDGGAA